MTRHEDDLEQLELARVLSGAVSPSGRLPVSVPAHAGAQPATYIGPALARRSVVSSLDPSPLYPFGHGLSYTTFSWADFECPDTRVPPGRPGDPAGHAARRLRAGPARAGPERTIAGPRQMTADVRIS